MSSLVASGLQIRQLFREVVCTDPRVLAWPLIGLVATPAAMFENWVDQHRLGVGSGRRHETCPQRLERARVRRGAGWSDPGPARAAGFTPAASMAPREGGLQPSGGR